MYLPHIASTENASKFQETQGYDRDLQRRSIGFRVLRNHDVVQRRKHRIDDTDRNTVPIFSGVCNFTSTERTVRLGKSSSVPYL